MPKIVPKGNQNKSKNPNNSNTNPAGDVDRFFNILGMDISLLYFYLHWDCIFHNVTTQSVWCKELRLSPIIWAMSDDYEIVRKFSKRLRELREKNGLTQEKLAEIADISYKNVQYLESKNPTCPSLITINKLAKALKTTPSKILDF